jgi:hypothetical protein
MLHKLITTFEYTNCEEIFKANVYGVPFCRGSPGYHISQRLNAALCAGAFQGGEPVSYSNKLH